MLASEAQQWFTEEFLGRFASEVKPALTADWKDAVLPYPYKVAVEAIRKCYQQSTAKPTIDKFRSMANSLVSFSQVEKKEDEYIQSDYFVQLCGIDGKENGKEIKLKWDLTLGYFQRITCFASQNPTPERLSFAANNLRKKLMRIYGGDWQVIDYSGEFLNEKNRNSKIMDSIYDRKEKLQLRQKQLCQSRQ